MGEQSEYGVMDGHARTMARAAARCNARALDRGFAVRRLPGDRAAV
jgi:hypothetical protein